MPLSGVHFLTGVLPVNDFATLKARDRVGGLDVAKHVPGGGKMKSIPEVHKIAIHSNGLTMACGTSTGHVLTFDVRSSKPLLVKDHQYGLGIKSVAFHEKTNNIVSSDSKVVKFYNQDTGKNFARCYFGIGIFALEAGYWDSRCC
jgi:ribosome biogenesis protein ENP2